MTSSYEYTSTKIGSDASALFDQADVNHDGVIDRGEFANLVGSSDSGVTGTSYSVRRGGDRYGSLAYDSRFSSGVGLESTGYGGHYHTSYESIGGLDATALRTAASYTAESNPAWTRYGAEVRGIGLFHDHHPEIIRREAQHGALTYTQNIRVRFLQPPPVPPPGPLIIKEVRPPQPPALPPLRIKQYEHAAQELAPLILRERPPLPPAPLPSETVVRHLPALPVPPRSVIIERYAAAAPRPRDIIIERWLPYGPSSERKTIIQRAEAAISYAAAHNVIIEYETAEVRIVRQFQNLGVHQENPKAYLARYGEELLDAHTLLHRARAAGVFEDISTPAAIAASGFHSLTYNSDGSHTHGHIHGVGGEVSLVGVTGEDLGGISTTYTTTGYDRSLVGGSGTYVGGTRVVEGGGGGYRSATYESSSYSSSGGADAASAGFTTTEARL